MLGRTGAGRRPGALPLAPLARGRAKHAGATVFSNLT